MIQRVQARRSPSASRRARQGPSPLQRSIRTSCPAHTRAGPHRCLPAWPAATKGSYALAFASQSPSNELVESPGPRLVGHEQSVFNAQYTIGERLYPRIVSHHKHRTRRILCNIRQQAHDRKTILSIERGSWFVCKDHGRSSHDSARDRDALLLATAEIARKRIELVRKADRDQSLLCLVQCVQRALAAHIQWESRIVFRSEGRKQVIVLENKSDVFPPHLRQLFRPQTCNRTPGNSNQSGGGRQHASQHRQQSRFAAAGWPHQKRQFATF